MKTIEEHAPNCNCDRCSPECGAVGQFGGDLGWGLHTCNRKAPHKGKHECCCGEQWAKAEVGRQRKPR